MSALTIRMADDKYQRLKELSCRRRTSVNQLFGGVPRQWSRRKFYAAAFCGVPRTGKLPQIGKREGKGVSYWHVNLICYRIR